MTTLTIGPRRSRPELPPLVRAKLSRPNPGLQVLDRPRLVQALADHAARPLTLVIADAGFGKTTLLAAFARGAARPVVWYSLMPSDADPIVFGRYLLEGFRRESPRFGKSFQVALDEARPGGRAAEMLGGTFANELATLKGPPILLVLDDFQDVAGNPAVVAFMDTLLRHLPPSVRILLSARTPPPLALDRMRARGEVFELNSNHLRLTRLELGRLFDEVYEQPLADHEITALEETTLGWPTAIHLVHESLRRTDSVGLESVLAQLRASPLELHDYLSSEVYARLDAESKLLLEHTAALPRFDADLAATLAGVRSPRPTLEVLARRGLLRTFGTGDQATYECHDLVRRFVRHEIEEKDGADGWRSLEAETAVVLAARGEHEAALGHYLLAGRAVEAGALLRQLAPDLLRQGRAPALVRYLADLPAAVVREDLPLALAHAESLQATGVWDEAEPRFTDLLDRARAAGALEIECRALLGLGKLLNLRGRHEQVLGMAERGLARASALPLELRAKLLQMKAGAHFYLGQFRAAVEVLDQVRGMLGPAADPELLTPTVHNLAMAYAAQGRFREASTELKAALGQVRGTTSPRAPLYLSNLALLHSDLGELPEARRAAEEGLAASQRFSNRAHEVTCRQGLAQTLAQSGDFDGALAELKRAEELNAELRMEMVTAELLALRARIFCHRGEYRRAVEFANEAIDVLKSRPDDPRVVEFRALRAWCELRAGRLRVARDLLAGLVQRADVDENDHRRMRIHYWLGETMLALGEKRGLDEHLGLALELVRERGYLSFLKAEAREEPAPLLHALERGIELDVVAAALVEAGGGVEAPILALLDDAAPRIGEAAIAVLGEVGGRAAVEGLERIARERRPLKSAIKTALRHIAERLGRGATTAAEEPRAARLVLFGPPQLLVEGRPVSASAWRAQRAFHMLVHLALHPRGASKDELLERFWPGRQLAAGRRNFHPTLSYIRSVLPAAAEAPILRELDLYRLNPAYPLSCDAWDLERALDEARTASGVVARRTALERAAALASGPFLQGLYANWSDELQVRMRDRAEKLLLDLGELCARQADFERALDYFRRASELDEYRESTRLAVIECLVRIGNRRAALVEYDKLKALLRSELAVDPLPETAEAMERLIAGKGAHGWPEGLQEMPQDDAAESVAESGQVALKRRSRKSSR